MIRLQLTTWQKDPSAYPCKILKRSHEGGGRRQTCYLLEITAAPLALPVAKARGLLVLAAVRWSAVLEVAIRPNGHDTHHVFIVLIVVVVELCVENRGLGRSVSLLQRHEIVVVVVMQTQRTLADPPLAHNRTRAPRRRLAHTCTRDCPQRRHNALAAVHRHLDLRSSSTQLLIHSFSQSQATFVQCGPP